MGNHQKLMLAAQLRHIDYLDEEIGRLDEEIKRRTLPFEEDLALLGERTIRICPVNTIGLPHVGEPTIFYKVQGQFHIAFFSLYNELIFRIGDRFRKKAICPIGSFPAKW